MKKLWILNGMKLTLYYVNDVTIFKADYILGYGSKIGLELIQSLV